MSAALEQFRLPLFPLNAVVFPGGRLPLRIFEQRYLDMVKQAIADDTPFGICAPVWGTPAGAPPLRGDPSAAIREGAKTGAPAAPFSIGTRVRVTDWDMPQAGILHIDTQAEERFVVRSTRTEPGGLLIGSVEAVSAEPASAIPDELELAVEILRHIIDEYGNSNFPAPHEFDNAVWVGYRLSEVLPLKLSVKQNLLEMNDSAMRLRILTEFLKKQVN
ncbi:MAG: LON peptidase substrate-binding domain-containing protein [Thiobacillus sp.]|nr:LON peptidase substrate-binding domain-containing protein [Thiobacillus sp.]